MEILKRLVPWLLAHGNAAYERWIAGRKRALFACLSGTVVEIGPGAGANFPFFGTSVRWIGVEPNRFARPYLEQFVRKAPPGTYAKDIRDVTRILGK